jgi:hypothetical protein
MGHPTPKVGHSAEQRVLNLPFLMTRPTFNALFFDFWKVRENQRLGLLVPVPLWDEKQPPGEIEQKG